MNVEDNSKILPPTLDIPAELRRDFPLGDTLKNRDVGQRDGGTVAVEDQGKEQEASQAL